ncbi:MAG: CpaF family protein [Eubacteriaceae bacterium]|nr:CpaF family protein [Eubacteriaceae bacterium]
MGILERLEKQKAAQQESSDNRSSRDLPGKNVQSEGYYALKQTVHSGMIEAVNRDKREDFRDDDEKEAYYKSQIENIIDSRDLSLTRAERIRLVEEVYDDVAGFGPLEPLLRNPDITEIMVNGPDRVYVEMGGRIKLSPVTFIDNEHVMNVINRIVSSVGRRIDEANPMVDARLPDGSRVNAVIPPVALSGPTITIRKFSKKPLSVGDLVNFGSVSPKMMSFLEACVKGRVNVIVSGGTGSGKTTLLGVLSGYIPDDERIVTIEDAAELQLRQEHVVTLESRPANIEGTGQITIRDLVRNALRMRPDRIVVGEVRSGETLDMLQAMNTGHDGSLTTAHANSPRDVVSRLETMVLMGGIEMPVRAIREQIASAIDIIVHQARMRDGSRKVVSITEVVGMEGDVITLQDIYTYRKEGLDATGKQKGSFVASGVRPSFMDDLEAMGILVRDDWFQN